MGVSNALRYERDTTGGLISPGPLLRNQAAARRLAVS